MKSARERISRRCMNKDEQPNNQSSKREIVKLTKK